MGKFKVGDRVRTTNPEEPWNGVGTIIKQGSFCWIVDFDGEEGGFMTEQLVPVAPQQQLTIREGAYYRTRDGRKVGPMKPDGAKFVWAEVDGVVRSFERAGGKHYIDELNLIAEWVDEPAADAAGDDEIEVGDRVRVVRLGRDKGGSDHGAEIGKEYVITDVIDGEYFTSAYYFYRHEIEKVSKPAAGTPTPTTGFTVPLDAEEDGSREVDEIVVRVTVDASGLNDELDLIGKRLKKLKKRARKLGLKLDYAEAA